MGGFGQIFGSMGRGMAGGMGGMGGMGRGMGGLGGLGSFGAGRGGAAGGQGASNGAQNQSGAAEGNSSDLYDVDRWQRAEEEQAAANREYADTGLSALEQVKKEWENKSDKKTSRLKKLLRKDTDQASRKPRGAAAQAEQTDYAGTQYVRANPARKMVEERKLGQSAEVQEQSEEERFAGSGGEGYSAPVKSEFERFFSSNPINSTILSVDSLSMGPLTMNQLYRSSDSGRASRQWSHNSDTGYMDNLKESGQRRKYEVHIVNGD